MYGKVIVFACYLSKRGSGNSPAERKASDHEAVTLRNKHVYCLSVPTPAVSNGIGHIYVSVRVPE